jgi:hypothetical protein
MSEPDLPPTDEQPRLSSGERATYVMVIIAVLVIIGLPLLIPVWNHFHPAASAVAESKYDFIKKNGTLDDLCEAANAVKQAYSDSQDADNYKLWQITADLDCMKARQDGGYLPAADAERAKIHASAENLIVEDDYNAVDMNNVDVDVSNVDDDASSAAAGTADSGPDAPAADVASATKYPGNCYKDYCPCEQPQEGMDSVLCDQLEAGLDVPIESMIAGRGFREARRQAAELGY